MIERNPILEAIINRFKEDKNILLTGQAGTGKTYVLNEFLDWLKINGYNVGLAGSTGVAAINIGGTTVHRLFGINMAKDIDEFTNLMETEEMVRRNHFKRLDELLDFDLIVIDEVSMIGKKIFELLDFVLKKGTGELNKPFGGKQIMLTGDFLQLPPVRDDYAFNSETWSEARFSVIHLTKVHRQSNPEFLDILTKLRLGYYDDSVEEFISKRVYYGEVNNDATKLYARNKSVDEENQKMLDYLPGKKKTYWGEDEGDSGDVKRLLNNITAPVELELKVGAKVMTLKNDEDLEYVNGSIGHVVKLNTSTVVVEFEDGTKSVISDHTWKSKDAKGNIVASFTQLPLRLAYALTMHKSQGMTIDGELFIDCDGIRSDGQFYVAMSRIKNPDKLRIINFNRNVVRASSLAKSFYGK